MTTLAPTLGTLQKGVSVVALGICALLWVELFCFICSTKAVGGTMTTTSCHFGSFVVWAFPWLRETKASWGGLGQLDPGAGRAPKCRDGVGLVTPLR